MNLYDTSTPWLLPDHSMFHHTDDRMLSHQGGGFRTLLKKRKHGGRHITRYSRDKRRKESKEAVPPGQRRVQFGGIGASPLQSLSRTPSVPDRTASLSLSLIHI